MDSSKIISYFVVPVLTIPDTVLIRDSINMVKYFAKGTLTVNGAECCVLKDEIPVATLILSDKALLPARPEIFKDYIRKRDIDEVRKSDLYFMIAIETSFYRAYTPGIIFLNNKRDFMFLNYIDNGIYSISEIYRALFNNEDEFRQYIKRFVEKSVKN